MPSPEYLAIADVQDRLVEIVERLERDHGRVVITKHGRPAAIMLSVEDLESLEETLVILGDPVLLRGVQRAEREATAGKAKRLTRDDVLRRISRS